VARRQDPLREQRVPRCARREPCARRHPAASGDIGWIGVTRSILRKSLLQKNLCQKEYRDTELVTNCDQFRHFANFSGVYKLEVPIWNIKLKGD
jgi:hypothetical protein